MKRRMILGFIVVIMAVAMIACGKKETDQGGAGTENAVKAEISSADDALNQIFDTYAEDEKFPIMGGDANNIVDGKAGVCSLADVESLTATVHISAELAGKVKEVASAVHMMNANTFTAAAFRLTDAKNAEKFVAELKDSVLSTQWMCGFPEKISIYTVNDGYVIYGLGAADLVNNFTQKLEAVYGEAATGIVEQNVE